MTRTLFIVPIVLIFSWIYARKETTSPTDRVNINQIFPWFIGGFLIVVAINSTGIIPSLMVNQLSFLSKFFLSMALAAIGLRTSIKEVAGVGITPMIAGVIIDTSVVIVSFLAQSWIVSTF